jgi:hypothetical protein
MSFFFLRFSLPTIPFSFSRLFVSGFLFYAVPGAGLLMQATIALCSFDQGYIVLLIQTNFFSLISFDCLSLLENLKLVCWQLFSL